MEVSYEIMEAMSILLTQTPPDSHIGNVYAVTDFSHPTIGDGWGISLVNIVSDPPYYNWNLQDNAVWAGAVICESIEQDQWQCHYIVPNNNP